MFSWLLSLLRHIFITPPSLLLHYLVILPFRSFVHYTSLPFQYLASLLQGLAVFAYQLVASFEAFFTFAATAALVGICAGCLLHFSSRVWISIFHISRANEAAVVEVKPATRTVEGYRKVRSQRKRQEEHGMRIGAQQVLEDYRLGGGTAGGQGLYTGRRSARDQTIFEEPSSEDS
ncbi:MAG: hypothetical protein M1828_004914 [Chrysothrix sp. TS-e1954]|nr:MAG: hypothetical protein M1828_004914 [Chrysothrix sp. TS-e1954]